MILSDQSEVICFFLHRPKAVHVRGFDMLMCSVYVQAMFKAKGKSPIYRSNPLVMDL